MNRKTLIGAGIALAAIAGGAIAYFRKRNKAKMDITKNGRLGLRNFMHQNKLRLQNNLRHPSVEDGLQLQTPLK